MTPRILLHLAIQANVDGDAIPVLGDAVIEAGWRDTRVMPLALGFELDPVRPYFQNATQRESWERMRDRGFEGANNAWDMYAGKHPAWARAVLAVMLFGDWPPKRRRRERGATTSPFRMIRRMCQERRDREDFLAIEEDARRTA